jgi:hypothetical protein
MRTGQPAERPEKEEGSPRPSLHSSTSEAQKTLAIPDRATKAPGDVATLTEEASTAIEEKESHGKTPESPSEQVEEEKTESRSVVQFPEPSLAEQQRLRKDVERILEMPSPLEPNYLRLIQRNLSKWEEYLSEQVLTDPSQFKTFEPEVRREIERNFVAWLAEQLEIVVTGDPQP